MVKFYGAIVKSLNPYLCSSLLRLIERWRSLRKHGPEGPEEYENGRDDFKKIAEILTPDSKLLS